MAGLAFHEHRISGIVWLEVNIIVTSWRSTLFSSDNAASTRAHIDSNRSTAFDSNSLQAEVLVEGSVKPKWLIFPPQ